MRFDLVLEVEVGGVGGVEPIEFFDDFDADFNANDLIPNVDSETELDADTDLILRRQLTVKRPN
jgi:hypothetical protein